MNDAVLIFTFSPVQGSIAEARRASDLYAGSRILAQLAVAAVDAVQRSGGSLVYPCIDQGLGGGDVPNKLVALVPWQQAAEIGRAAESALRQRWGEIAGEALGRMRELALPEPDAAWQAIWQRQTAPGYLWQCFWAAADMAGRDYAAAYREASRALDAVKRSRRFPPAEEQGDKDSLSGKREALHGQGERGREYWPRVSRLERVTGAMLRGDGRERLDAIGAAKRFWPQASFPSTSTVAAAPFLAAAREKAPTELAACRDALESAFGGRLHTVTRDADWPYDGDLLFEDTLTPQRLAASYGVTTTAEAVVEPREALRQLRKAVGASPSPYYAMVVLDGDDMGKRIEALLDEPDAQAKHRQFGQKLSGFAAWARSLAERRPEHVIYNGGDDVLALAPATTAIDFARALADGFRSHTGGTASAGIAIAHHLAPLDATLAAAREAERLAKGVSGKNALCVSLRRRGGEATTARGRWETTVAPLQEMVGLMESPVLSGRLAHDVVNLAYSVPQPGDMLLAELKRLLRRRSEGKLGEDRAKALNDWVATLPGIADVGTAKGHQSPNKTEELGKWLLIARFLAAKGGDGDAAVS